MCCTWLLLITHIRTYIRTNHLNHTHAHTALVLTDAHHAHTYNILPGFESICGSTQSPLHKLFVTIEWARRLLLWWSSERTQLCQWELRKQHWRLKALILYTVFIWLQKHIRFLFFFFSCFHSYCGWIRQLICTTQRLSCGGRHPSTVQRHTTPHFHWHNYSNP